ncbi:MAG TPA: MarR family transcriptional regulator [Ghiorsea sp.]|nr:MarR family transcriptional regulator [Ghiorsea sp.]
MIISTNTAMLWHMKGLQNCENIEIGTIMPLIGQVMCFMRQQISQAYQDLGYDIAPESAQAMMIIQHFDGLPQSKLADILGKDKAAITRLLNSLVKLNLVERIQDKNDRRIIRAHITPEGKAVFEQFMPKLQALSDLALAGVSSEAFLQTVATMTKITGNIHTACCKKTKGSTGGLK